jgi:hypothetical protein
MGFAVQGVLSGGVIEILTYGQVTPASGMNNLRPGKPVFVNASGFVGNVSGGFLSGGVHAVAALSGGLTQFVGLALHSGSAWLSPDISMSFSGAAGYALQAL